MHTRTHDCLHLFASAFQSADTVFITEIYAAGEQPIREFLVKFCHL